MTKTFKDLKPGDEVYVVWQESRYRNPYPPETVSIVKLGRQYGYIKLLGWSDSRFSLSDGKGDGSFDVFLSKEHYDEWKHAQDTISKAFSVCRKFFGDFGRPVLPLAAAEEILAIFDKYKLER